MKTQAEGEHVGTFQDEHITHGSRLEPGLALALGMNITHVGGTSPDGLCISCEFFSCFCLNPVLHVLLPVRGPSGDQASFDRHFSTGFVALHGSRYHQTRQLVLRLPATTVHSTQAVYGSKPVPRPSPVSARKQ